MLEGTTVLGVRMANGVALGGDGQITLGGNAIVKHGARKVRRLYGGRVLAGFAGSVGDALALFERFEEKLQAHGGQLERAAVELSRLWRIDRALRRLEALLIVADRESMLLLSGSGEIIEPDDGILAIGSGGSYALAAARALRRHTELGAGAIVREALTIASEICVYTNDRILVEEL